MSLTIAIVSGDEFSHICDCMFGITHQHNCFAKADFPLFVKVETAFQCSSNVPNVTNCLNTDTSYSCTILYYLKNSELLSYFMVLIYKSHCILSDR